MKAIYILTLVLSLEAMARGLASKSENCKLSVRTIYKTGKKKVQVEEITVSTRAECKEEAKRREAAIDEDIEKIQTSFSFKE